MFFPYKLLNSQFSIGPFPRVCSLQERIVAILSYEFELLPILLVFPSIFAPELIQDVAGVFFAIGTCPQSPFEAADLDSAFCFT